MSSSFNDEESPEKAHGEKGYDRATSAANGSRDIRQEVFIDEEDHDIQYKTLSWQVRS